MTRDDSFKGLKPSILKLFEDDDTNGNDIIERNLFKTGLLADLLIKYLIVYAKLITSDDINERLQARMALSMIDDIKETIEGANK